MPNIREMGGAPVPLDELLRSHIEIEDWFELAELVAEQGDGVFMPNVSAALMDIGNQLQRCASPVVFAHPDEHEQGDA